MQGPREIELFSAGMRGRQWMGADRAYAVAVVTLSAMLALFGLAIKLWFLLVLAPVLFMGSLWALRRFYRLDPVYFKVYLRAVFYLEFYAAKGGLYTRKARQFGKGWL